MSTPSSSSDLSPLSSSPLPTPSSATSLAPPSSHFSPWSLSLPAPSGLNTWGFVLYNNLLSLMIAPLFWFLTGENLEVFDALKSGSGSLFDPSALAAVGLSCVFGLAISFFGFAARKQKRSCRRVICQGKKSKLAKASRIDVSKWRLPLLRSNMFEFTAKHIVLIM
ncbi:hypothetical protein S83_020713, partial [Arachis hypogaea]